METEIKNRLEALLRIVQFPAVTGYVLNARGTVLLGNIGAALTQMQAHATDQIGGKGDRHAGSILRSTIAEALRLELVDIGKTGRSLDPEVYPGVGAKFRLPASDRSYQALRATAEAYLEAIGPVKAAFVEREYAADFDEQLSELIAGFDAATQSTDAALQGQSGGTAGLRVVSSRALKAVAELDAMITRKLRKSDPALLQVWKQTRHVERPPKAKKTTGTPPATAAGAAGPGSSLGVSLALNGPTAEPADRVEPRMNGSAVA